MLDSFVEGKHVTMQVDSCSIGSPGGPVQSICFIILRGGCWMKMLGLSGERVSAKLCLYLIPEV